MPELTNAYSFLILSLNSCGLPLSFMLGSILLLGAVFFFWFLFFLNMDFSKSCFAKQPICLAWDVETTDDQEK